MRTVSDLSADELAQRATVCFYAQGRTGLAVRLTFRALELDPEQPDAIRCLSDLMDPDGLLPENERFSHFSAVALEYGVSLGASIHPEKQRILRQWLTFAKWSWAFSKHKGGKTLIGMDEFEVFADASQFEESPEYSAFLGSVVERAGGLTKAFQAAHRFLGIIGGILVVDAPRQPTTEDAFEPTSLHPSERYLEWLRSDPAPLDEFANIDELPPTTIALVEPVVATVSPPLVVILYHLEKSLGSPLTEDQVTRLAKLAPSIALQTPWRQALDLARGYEDIDAEEAWTQWSYLRNHALRTPQWQTLLARNPEDQQARDFDLLREYFSNQRPDEVETLEQQLSHLGRITAEYLTECRIITNP